MASLEMHPHQPAKQKKHSVKIDMTPMVDLGFLLITFFIFTTSLMKPAVTKLVMPKEDKVPVDVTKRFLLTTLLDKDKVYVYEGALEDAIAKNKLIATDYNVQSGLGNYIRQKQKRMEGTNEKANLMVVIKPLPAASYQDVINALDEMQINDVKRYGIIDASKEEKDYVTRIALK